MLYAAKALQSRGSGRLLFPGGLEVKLLEGTVLVCWNWPHPLDKWHSWNVAINSESIGCRVLRLPGPEWRLVSLYMSDSACGVLDAFVGIEVIKFIFVQSDMTIF